MKNRKFSVYKVCCIIYTQNLLICLYFIVLYCTNKQQCNFCYLFTYSYKKFCLAEEMYFRSVSDIWWNETKNHSLLFGTARSMLTSADASFQTNISISEWKTHMIESSAFMYGILNVLKNKFYRQGMSFLKIKSNVFLGTGNYFKCSRFAKNDVWKMHFQQNYICTFLCYVSNNTIFQNKTESIN